MDKISDMVRVIHEQMDGDYTSGGYYVLQDFNKAQLLLVKRFILSFEDEAGRYEDYDR